MRTIHAVVLSGLVAMLSAAAPGWAAAYQYNDSHVHLTNFIQEGTSAHDFLKLMDGRVGRAVLFGLPLQQQWSYRVSGEDAPTYYLDSDAHLYYYSFTDAIIAKQFLSLSKKDQARFDPMITGFNPTDMYAADHIRRVLKLFPGVFEGIGEFSIHKEFVSSKIAGDVASLTDPALDRILDLAGEAGLVVLLHSDVDRPFAPSGKEPVFLTQTKDLFRRHPKASIIWAHTGMGRIVHPANRHAAMLEMILKDPAFKHVNFDISWDEVAKYIVATPESVQIAADLINRYPDRFLFGSDEVAPTKPEKYFKVFELYAPLWAKLTPEARKKVCLTNYERVFNEGRRRVRAWERKQ